MVRLDGVKKVDKGWSGWRETNTVVFDPKKTSVKEMEEALKEAGTYRKTLKVE